MDREDDAQCLPASDTPDVAAVRDGATFRGRPPGPVPVVVRSPDDLLACATLALGFVPERSVVLLTLSPERGPHARVDLADDPDEVPELARALVRPALRHRVTRVALVVLADLATASAAAPLLEDAFTDAGIDVVALVGADGSRWLSLLRGQRTTVPREYDQLGHPFVADAVLRGQVVLASREAVRATVAPDPAFVRAVTRVLRRAHDGPFPGAPASWNDAARVRGMLESAARTGDVLSAAEVAYLLVAVADPSCRDAAWSWVARKDARAHVDVWLRVVSGCPDRFVGPAASVLAFHAWLAGDGALARCALDRSRRGAHVTLATLVEDLLEAAASPDVWQPQVGAAEVDRLADVVSIDRVRRASERPGGLEADG